MKPTPTTLMLPSSSDAPATIQTVPAATAARMAAGRKSPSKPRTITRASPTNVPDAVFSRSARKMASSWAA